MLAFIPYKSHEFKDFSKDECDKRPYEYIFEDHDEIYDSEAEVEEYEPSEQSSNDQGNIFYEMSMRNLDYGDLYILGLIWIKNLKTLLIGAPFRLLPVVKAEKKEPPPPPEKPPKMKYKELPIYQSPHYEYKEYVIDKEKCPLANTKLLHQYMLSYVKQYRKDTQSQMNTYISNAKKSLNDAFKSIESTKNDVKKYMRDSNNLHIRQGLVAGAISTGFIMGSGIPRRLFYSGLGGLASGALCFPKETDESFRNFLYNSTKKFISMYNLYCSKNFSMRERVPCAADLPPEPPKRPSKCPRNK